VNTAFLYTNDYFAYDYGSEHPMRIERLRLTFDLSRDYGLFDLPGADLVETRPALEEEVLRFHDPGYIQALKKAGRFVFHGGEAYGLGQGDNPVFPGMWEWSLLQTGATLQCARLVSEGKVRVAFNIAGGLHHALKDRASGFCYVNDPVLAIFHFLDRGKRVLYLDIDAHHGDGVQWAFYDDPRVLTVSFHQDGRTLFPGTGHVAETGDGPGKGYSVNVPMLPGTDDFVFWKGFLAVVPRLLETFRPDVLVSQLGVDSFVTDPLASLEITTNGFSRVVSFLAQKAPAWVALGGGGYELTNVARAWTLAWAIMNGVELPENLPDRAVERWSGSGFSGRRLRDPEHPSSQRSLCLKQMDVCVAYLEREVFPRVEGP
jgi:acetoin utilization protein AcuC